MAKKKIASNPHDQIHPELDSIMKSIQNVLTKKNFGSLKPLSIEYEVDDDECDEGYHKVCKTYKDKDGNYYTKCWCVRN